ncbi:MAG: hypothetical protein QMC38_08855 [Sinobacterium sp.]
MDKVPLLPHTGSATGEAFTAMDILVADNLEVFMSDTSLPNKVV